MLNLVVIHRRRGHSRFIFFPEGEQEQCKSRMFSPSAGLPCLEAPIPNPVGTGFPRRQTCRKNRNPLSGSRKSYFYMKFRIKIKGKYMLCGCRLKLNLELLL